MDAKQRHEFIERAERFYAARLRAVVEPEHRDEYIAIEPDSGDYFLGTTLSEAIGAASEAHPDRLVHTMRVGHSAALHFGMSIQ